MCVVTLLAQMALLDYFLVYAIHPAWAFWILVDVGCVAMFIVSMVMSSNRYHGNDVRRQKIASRGWISDHIFGKGELPFGHIAWFVYGLQFCVRLIILFE